MTPLTTGKAVAKANGFGPLAALAGDAFNNSAKIGALRAPLLILHGTSDEIIPYQLGRALFDQAPYPKKLVSIKGAGHNDISMVASNRYWKPIEQWINAEQH